VLTARSAKNLAERVAESKNLGGTAIAHPTDQRQPAAPAGVVAAALAEYGRLDFIVGSAGAPQRRSLATFST
jgi:NADP-dependent 3-hydroxy acid dehydrogenase YdfG